MRGRRGGRWELGRSRMRGGGIEREKGRGSEEGEEKGKKEKFL